MARPIRERFGGWLDALESRWSLAAHGATLVTSFGLPAWAAWAANIFAEYSPLSWVIAGFCGVLFWALIRLLWHWGYRIKVNAKYDERFIERSGNYNPLDLTFERKRIYLDDFVLPSHPIIEGKTFIDCDIVGPATMYFHSNNIAHPIRPPKFDAVWLHPLAKLANFFTFNNCIFRNCSFQRITMFASIENYDNWKDNSNINWVGIPPSRADIEQRQKDIEEGLRRAGLPPPVWPEQKQEALPGLLEHTATMQN